jgi:hypothetical protein
LQLAVDSSGELQQPLLLFCTSLDLMGNMSPLGHDCASRTSLLYRASTPKSCQSGNGAGARQVSARLAPASAPRASGDPGRVEDGRGSLGPMASAPFPIPAHRTGRADFPHPALRLASPRGTRKRLLTASVIGAACFFLRLAIQLSLKDPDHSRCLQAHRQSPSPRHLRKHTRSQGPFLRRHYPASAVLRTSPPPQCARPVPHGLSVGHR